MPHRLLFVSPRFLFPIDSGGKIRTAQILTHVDTSRFHRILLSPATSRETQAYAANLAQVADEFVPWPHTWIRETLGDWWRGIYLFSRLPIPIRSDASRRAREVIARERRRADLTVYDFLHAAVLAPADKARTRRILFTHNVEVEIFERHAEVAANPLAKAVWRSQAAKMARFEGRVIHSFDRVIAVSERDRKIFEERYRADNVRTIRTGVDLSFFRPSELPRSHVAVFTASMDWRANIDAVAYFLDEVWPQVRAAIPDARFVVVGRSPPTRLLARARRDPSIEVTGSVPDARPYMRRASVCVVPLRVGGGTRLKIFEAMAMGRPVVSTSIGVEGLGLRESEDFLRADDSKRFAAHTIRLMSSPDSAQALANRARRYVEQHASAEAAASDFLAVCDEVLRQ